MLPFDGLRLEATAEGDDSEEYAWLLRVEVELLDDDGGGQEFVLAGLRFGMHDDVGTFREGGIAFRARPVLSSTSPVLHFTTSVRLATPDGRCDGWLVLERLDGAGEEVRVPETLLTSIPAGDYCRT